MLDVMLPPSVTPSDVIGRFTYEIAPVFVLMEQLTLKKMREMIGWPNGEGDGLFSPGRAHEGVEWGLTESDEPMPPPPPPPQ